MTLLVDRTALKMRLAQEYFEVGLSEKALNLINQFQGHQRLQFRQTEYESHHQLGIHYCAENDFPQARTHFSEAVQLANTPADVQIYQARLATLNRLSLNPSPPLPASIKQRSSPCLL